MRIKTNLHNMKVTLSSKNTLMGLAKQFNVPMIKSLDMITSDLSQVINVKVLRKPKSKKKQLIVDYRKVFDLK